MTYNNINIEVNDLSIPVIIDSLVFSIIKKDLSFSINLPGNILYFEDTGHLSGGSPSTSTENFPINGGSV